MSITTCLVLPSKLEGITKLHGTETEHTAVWNFETSLKTAWGVYPHLSDETKCNFILQNLGTIPRDEIRFYHDNNDPEELFKILHKVFGDHRSWGQMLHQFIGISQLSNESVQVFSHRIMEAWQAILRAQSQRGSQVVTDTLLIDVFVNGLRDSFLKKVLKEDLFLSPATTIYELREKALRWESAALMVKDHSTGDSEVSLQPEEIDSSNEQLEVTLFNMCSKLEAFVSNISVQTSIRPTRRKRKRRRRRRKMKDSMTFDDQTHQVAPSYTSEVSLAQDSMVARSMSAYIVPATAYNIAIEKSTENDKSVVESQNELFVQKDETETKETISVKSCDVWALYGDKGQTMIFLKENSGCKINVSKAEGDRSKGLRNIELVGTISSIEKAKLLIKDTCGLEVI